MKFSTSTISTLLFGTLATAAPVCQPIQNLQKRQDGWAVDLYQNNVCSGERDSRSGSGNDCESSFLNGSAAAFQLISLPANCEIRFFNDATCEGSQVLDATQETPLSTCIPFNSEASSFTVTCS